MARQATANVVDALATYLDDYGRPQLDVLLASALDKGELPVAKMTPT